MKTYDCLVIGSGCSGAMAAQTLIEAGVTVAMVDVGVKSDVDAPPEKDFLSIRQTDSDQYKYTIGKNGEGISWSDIGKGAQLTPPRNYMTKDVSNLMPLFSDNFFPIESLGYGGLGIGWGLQCWEYSTADLVNTGLNPVRMNPAYEIISQRIGISAAADAAKNYTIGKLQTYQPAPEMDRNHHYIAQKYHQHQATFKNKATYVGRTPLALITQDKGQRKGYRYRGMDYYANDGLSAWRPYITVDQLRQSHKFTYLDETMVLRFSETDDLITCFVINTKTKEETKLHCRKLILAGNALSSARIVLRSLGHSGSRTSLLSNPHTYIPCLQPAMLGSGSESKKLGLGQLSYFIDPDRKDAGVSVASSYSYQELMLFRIISQIPLNFRDGRELARYLTPAMVIMIVQHPDTLSPAKYLQLISDKNSPTGDALKACYSLSSSEQLVWDNREKQYAKLMRSLKTFPLKRVKTPHGSSVHYAGTLPFSASQKEFSLAPEGRLHGTKHVYVADSSGFTYLPAKGLTFTLMANAHITADNVLHNR